MDRLRFEEEDLSVKGVLITKGQRPSCQDSLLEVECHIPGVSSRGSGVRWTGVQILAQLRDPDKLLQLLCASVLASVEWDNRKHLIG